MSFVRVLAVTSSFGVSCSMTECVYRAFSHDVAAATLVFQNNETTAMLVYKENSVGVELFSYVNALFCSNEFA